MGAAPALEPALSGPPSSGRRIESARNPRLRAAFALQRARDRREQGLSLLEGSRFVLDCLALGAPVVEVFADEALPAGVHGALVAAASRAGAQLFSVAPGVLQRLSGQPAAEGAAATVRIPAGSVAGLEGLWPLVLCHGIQSPGNLGAVVRVAAALGAGGVVGSGGSDPFGPKALRGAAGATFALPVVRSGESLAGLCATLRGWGYTLLLAEPRGGRSHRELQPPLEPFALVLGSEGSGLPAGGVPERLGAQPVTIELHGPVESLNVAVAAGILLDRLTARRPGAPRR
jgi:RNA methyltransferase, TrmH family